MRAPEERDAARPAVSWGWSEGHYVDRWLLVHLLSGVAGGASNVLFEMSVPGVYALALGLMVAWEIGEGVAGIRESWPNRAVDIGIGLVGVTLALGVAARVGNAAEWWLFGATTLATVGLTVVGFRAYRRRGGD